MSISNWKQWAAKAASALNDAQPRDRGGPEKPDRWNSMRTDLDRELRANPLCIGIREDADWKAAFAGAQACDSQDSALSFLTERLGNLIPVSDEWTDVEPPESRQWMVPGWLPDGRAGILSGSGGTGKSLLAIQLACAVAAGASSDEWLPTNHGDEPSMERLRAVAPAVAVFASWEDEPPEARRRRYWMRKETGGGLPWTAAERIGDRLKWIDARKCGPLWGPGGGHGGHVATTSGKTLAGDAIRRYCESVKARLLVLDPLAAAYGSDENVRALVRQFMADWDAWAQLNSCAVMLIAHPSKGEFDYSGSTDWHGAARWMWTLKREPGRWKLAEGGRLVGPGSTEDSKRLPNADGLTLSLAKANYGPPRSKLWLRMRGSGAAWEQCSEQESAQALLDLSRKNAADAAAGSEDKGDEWEHAPY